jgi:hypothetical protein
MRNCNDERSCRLCFLFDKLETFGRSILLGHPPPLHEHTGQRIVMIRLSYC